MLFDRRITIVALCAALAACGGGNRLVPGGPAGFNPTLRERAAGSSTTLTFVDQNATPLAKIWFCYYGLDPANGTPLYLADAKGTLKKSEPSSTPSSAYCVNAGSAKSFVIPELNGGRLYVSFAKPLLLTVGASKRIIPPNPAVPKDANYGTKWDFYELTYVPETGATSGRFNFNVSTLQSANLPMDFAVSGVIPGTKTAVSYTRGWKPGGAAQFVKQIQANAAYKQLVLAGTNRVLAPGTAIAAYTSKNIPNPIFPANYYDKYTDAVWTKYQTSVLTFIADPPPNQQKKVTWTGKVVGGQFVFTPEKNTLGLVPMAWKKPVTVDVFENNFKFCVKGCGTDGSLQQNYALQIFGTLIAAFNRSVMLTDTTFTTSPDGAWCKNMKNWYKDPTTNLFSSYMHANSLGGLAYAFQSDDHCDVSSFVAVWNPTNFKLTFLAN